MAGKRSYKGSHNAGHATHSTADNGNLTAALVQRIFEAGCIKHLTGVLYVRRKYCKHCFLLGQIQAAYADACICQILEQIAACSNILRVQVNAELCQIIKMSNAAGAGFVNRNFAAVTLTDAFAGNQSAGSIAEGGFYIHGNIAAHSNFHGTRMNNLSAVLCHLANLSIGNLLQNISLLDNARIGSHNALNVCINFNKISLERSAQCSSRGIAATAAQCRKFIVVFRHTLEAADNRNDACLQQTDKTGGIDVFDACGTKLRIGDDTRLTAGERHSVDTEFLQSCCHYTGGNDFAAAHHHIHLAHINGKVNVLQCADKSISRVGRTLASHCRNYNYRGVTVADSLLYLVFNCNAGFLTRDGGAAEFLYNDFHVNCSSYV